MTHVVGILCISGQLLSTIACATDSGEEATDLKPPVPKLKMRRRR